MAKSGSDLGSSSLGGGGGTGPSLAGGSGGASGRGLGAASQRQDSPMVDEMFDGMDAAIATEDANAAGGAAASLLSELTSSERCVHANFQKNFNVDLFDDSDLN